MDRETSSDKHLVNLQTRPTTELQSSLELVHIEDIANKCRVRVQPESVGQLDACNFELDRRNGPWSNFDITKWFLDLKPRRREAVSGACDATTYIRINRYYNAGYLARSMLENKKDTGIKREKVCHL
jgi:hypothetical protein